MARTYTGPILFIVHAPDTPFIDPVYAKDSGEQKAVAANEKKIIDALKIAGKRHIPVLYAPPHRKSLKKIIAPMEAKPRIITLPTNQFTPIEVSRALARARISPSQITCMGLYRNVCVTDWAIAAKTAFPSSRVTILEGTHSVLIPRKDKTAPREHRDVWKRKGILKAKKLLPRHLL